jgi:putative ABC transport system permease protein
MSARDRLSERAYRVLLRAYPRSFRERFESEMLEMLRTRRAAAARRGLGSRAAFWCRTIADMVSSAWHEARQAKRERHRRPLGLVRDITQAWRVLRRSPGLAALVIGLMALTVGATTTIFSVTNAVLLRPLPYGEPDRIVALWEQRPEQRVERSTIGAHEFPVWAANARTFDALAAYTWSGGSVHLVDGGEPVQLLAARVTGRFFDVMDVPPVLGRPIRPHDDVPGAAPVVVLGERLWRERFGGDPSLLGRSIGLNDRPHTVVGVMPERLRFPEAGPGTTAQLWVPIAEPIHLYRGRHYLFAVGRLRPDVDLEQANAELASVSAAIAAELPAFSRGHSARAWPLREDRSGPARPWLLLLLGAAACLVLIGCANVAGLLLARAETRRGEARVRLALGASRLTLARQLLVESLTLAIAGGVAGTAMAVLAARAVPTLVPAEIWALDALPVDWRVLGFALVLSIGTGLVFGIAPIVSSRRATMTGSAMTNRATLAPARSRARHWIVAGQIALALVLTSSAGLLARSLAALHRVDPAYRTEDVLSVDLSLPPSRYRDALQVRAFYDEVAARVGSLPGVTHVAAVDHVPHGGSFQTIAIHVEGRPQPAPGEEPSVRHRVVSAGYFDALGIPIIEGRGFASADARRAVPLIRWYEQQEHPPYVDEPQPMPVAVISDATARTFWPDGALGRRFRLLHSPWITVVGVAASTRADSLTSDPRLEVYLVDSQEPGPAMSLLVAADAPTGLAGDIRRAVWSVDPALPLGRIATLADLLATTWTTPRFSSLLVGGFAGTAVILMVAGVYGLLTFVAAARTPEIGLRMALGATQAAIRGMVLRHVLVMVVAGAAAGLTASLSIGPLLETMLFEVEPTDPVTLVTVVVLLTVVALGAAAVPASRAARVDPSRALRNE